jgi:arabinofuranan 3-O-arabinosyltransferase
MAAGAADSVVFRPVVTASVAGVALPDRPATVVPVDLTGSELVGVIVDGELVDLRDGPAPVRLRRGAAVTPVVSFDDGADDGATLLAATTVYPVPAPASTVTPSGGAFEVASTLATALPALGPFVDLLDCAVPAVVAPTEGPGRSDLRLDTTAGPACAGASLSGAVAVVPYRLRFLARPIGGAGLRVCVWQAGPGRCAPSTDTVGSAGASDYAEHQVRFVLDRNPGAVTVRLQARDGAVEVADVTAGPGLEEVIRLTTTSGSAATSIDGGTAPAANGTEPWILADTDAYDQDWTLDGLAAGVEATHLRLDGLRNGWVVSGGGTDTVGITFGPARWVAWANRSTLITLSFGALLLAFRLVHRRPGGPDRRRVPG